MHCHQPQKAPKIRHLVLADAQLPDLSVLLSQLPQDAQVSLIHPHTDALSQMAQAASVHRHLHGLHVLGHGEPGRMLLGNQWVDARALEQASPAMATLAAALADHAHIWLYGCHSGQGQVGARWLDAWALATGAAVHATDTVWQARDATLHMHTQAVNGLNHGNPLQANWQRSQWAHTLITNDGPPNTAPRFSPGSGSGTAVVPVAPEPNHDEAYSVVQQADGRLVVAGYSSSNANTNSWDFGLIRLSFDGSLDSTFGDQGKVIVPVGSGMDVAGSVIQQNDDKLVVAGYSQTGSQYVFSVIRLNADGSLDTSFGIDGKLLSLAGATSSEAYSVIQQADGKLVVAGSGDGSGSDFSIIRLNADGSLDTTFSSDGKLLVPVGTGEDFGTSVIQQIDGKLVVAGRSLSGFAITYGVVRLNADGALDTTFSDNGTFTTQVGSGGDEVSSVIQQADGKLVVAGSSDNGNGGREFSLIRLNEDGSLDSSFGNSGTLVMHAGSGFSDDFGRSVIQQADGKLVVAGSSSGSSSGFSLIRLNTDGSLDTTFGDGGKLIQPVGSGDYLAYQVIQQADDKLVVVGSSTDGSGANKNFSLIRLNEDGSRDNTFVGFSAHTLDIADYTEGAAAVVLDNAVQIQDAQLGALNGGNGNYSGAYLFLGRQGGARSQDVLGISTSGASFTISGGDLQSGGFTFATFANTPGTLSIEFTGSGTTPTQALLNDVLRHITYANSSSTPPASVNLEWTFSDGNSGSQGAGGELTATGISTVNITAANNTAPTLLGIPGTAQSVTAGTAAALADFTVADADGDNLTVTLTATNGMVGNLSDANSSTPGIQLTGTAASINAAISGASFTASAAGEASIGISVSDGVAASPTTGTYNLTATATVVQANTHPTFSKGAGTGKVTLDGGPQTDGVSDGGGFLQQPDGKMVVAYTNASNDFALVRLNPDGSFDTSFGVAGKARTPVGLSTDSAKSLILQADGKLVVAGYSLFGSFNQADFSVARLNADGSLDRGFGTGGTLNIDVTGTGVSDLAYSVVQQADGKLVLGGFSQLSSGNSDFSLVRLTTDGKLDESFGTGGKLLVPVGADFDNGRTLTLQPNGMLVMAGQTGTDLSLIRLDSNGNLDNSFGTGGKITVSLPATNDNPASILVQADGSLVVVGNSSSSTVQLSVIRLDDKGILDPVFANAGVLIDNLLVNGQAKSVIQQTDGKLVVAAQVIVPNQSYDIALLRLNANGSRDTSFGTDGVVTRSIRPESALGNDGSTNYSEVPFQVIQLADGKLAVAGRNDLGEMGIFRFNTDGSPDTTFGGSAVNTLGGTVAYTEGSAAVRLDTTVEIIDVQLAALNNGAGNYSGASLTLARQGGASTQDVLGISTSGASFTVSGNNLQSGGQTFATFSSANGSLNISFTGSGTPPTQAQVNDVLSHITYANSSNTPPASVTLDWSFSDGNSGSQGSGSALNATGTSTVNITAINAAPTIIGLPGTAQSVTVGSAAALADFTVADTDGDNLTVTLTATNGVLGNLTDADANTAGVQLTGTAASINASIAGATFTANGAGAASIGISVGDGVAANPTTGTYKLAVPSNSNPTFNAGVGTGKVVLSLDGEAKSVAQQADGKLVLVGRNGSDVGVVRLNDDGSADLPFNGDGKLIVSLSSSSDVANSVTVLADGTLAVAGHAGDALAVIRLLPNGTLDNAFDGDGKLTFSVGDDGHISSVIQQSDGQLVVAGSRTIFSTNEFFVSRFNSNGSPDNSFAFGSRFSGNFGGDSASGNAVIQQSDGTLVVVGNSFFGANGDFGIARLNGNGTLDSTFSGDGKLRVDLGSLNDVANFVIQQSDGKLVVAGFSGNGSSRDFSLIRLHLDGRLDESFSTDGKLLIPVGSGDDVGLSVIQQSDGKLVVAGYSASGSNADFSLVRVNGDGSLDTSFGVDGKVLLALGAGNDEGYSVIQQLDGKLLVVGSSEVSAFDPHFALARLNPDGSLDTTFGGSAVNTLGGTVAYTEGAAAVVLDSSVQLVDAQLGAFNSGNGNYSGASVTLARQGGANAEDVLGFSTTGASFTVSGSNLQNDGLTFATFTSSNGSLNINFTGSGTPPTQALVNDVLSHITYANSSGTPPASVNMAWNFRDGNSGSQGSGGALSATGISTVNITGINTAPTITGIPGTALSVPASLAAGTVVQLADFTVADADGDNLTVTLTATNGALGNLTDANSSMPGIQLTGTAASINAAIAGARFVLNGYGGSTSIGISVSDGVVASPTTGTYNVTNPAPTLRGIPGTAQSVTAGTAAALVDFSVADDDNLTVTLTPTNGTLGNLTDADSSTPGIQLTGTAASINDSIAGATFFASQAGAASIAISVSDGVAANPTTDIYSLTVVASNTAPSFGGTVGGTVVYRGSTAVVLDSTVQLVDTQLAALNSGTGNYSGSSLTLARQGGANSQDVLGISTSGVGFTVSGSNLQSGSQTFATFSRNNGSLNISFTGSGTAPTQALINDVLSHITYANSSSTPPASVSLDWTFNDGNSGSQGTGGALSAAGSSAVLIDQAPTLIGLPASAQSVTVGSPSALADFTVADPDGAGRNMTVTLTATNGTLGGLTYPYDASSPGVQSVQIYGTAATINGRIADATFTATSEGAASIGINVSDAFEPTTGTYSLVASPAPATNTNPTFNIGAGTGQTVVLMGSGIDTTVQSTDHSFDVMRQDDGKLLVAGWTGGLDFSIVRFNDDGSLDNTFGAGGKLVIPNLFSGDVGTIQQADGKLVVAGHSWTGEHSPNFKIIRLNADGSSDNTFSGDGVQIVDLNAGPDYGQSIVQQTNGKLVVAGYSNGFGGIGGDFSVIRLDTNGSLDTTFDDDGKLVVPIPDSGEHSVYSVIQQADGKLVLAGSSRPNIKEILQNPPKSLAGVSGRWHPLTP